MNLELSLLELNELYVATHRYAEQCRNEYNEYGNNVSSIAYLAKQLDKAEELNKKIQMALYEECKRLDEAREFVLNHINEEIEYANNMNEARIEDIRLGNL